MPEFITCDGDVMTDMEAERAALAQVLQEHPDLGAFGFGVFDARGKGAAQIAEEIAAGREKLLRPDGVAMFAAARGWLRPFPKTAHVTRPGTSHGLKHVAEPEIGYTFNGAFIAAAVAEGFRLRVFGPNACFNITKRAWANVPWRRGRL